MKKILILTLALVILLAGISVHAAELIGETDYFSELPEWTGDMALNENEWNETPLAKQGISFNQSSRYYLTQTRMSCDSGWVKLERIAPGTGSFRSTLEIPILKGDNVITDVFGANADTYIEEATFEIKGLQETIADGNGMDVYMSGKGWPQACIFTVFSDGIRENTKYTAAPFKINKKGEKITFIAECNYKTSKYNLYAKREGSEPELLFTNVGFAGSLTTQYKHSNAIGGFNYAFHIVVKGGTSATLYNAKIYKGLTVPKAENVGIDGAVEPGSALELKYDYVDGMPEENSEINWYMCDSDGGNAKLIKSAVFPENGDEADKQYVLTRDDLQGEKYIKATITPKSAANHPNCKTGGTVETPVKPLAYDMGAYEFYRNAADMQKIESTSDVWSTDNISIDYVSRYAADDLDIKWYADTTEIGTGKSVKLEDGCENKKISCKLSLKNDSTKSWTAELPCEVKKDNEPVISNLKFKDRNGNALENEVDAYTTLYPQFDFSDDGASEGSAEYEWFVGDSADDMQKVNGADEAKFSPVDYVGKYIKYRAKPLAANGNKDGNFTDSEAVKIIASTKKAATDAAFDETMPETTGVGAEIDVKNYIKITPTDADNVSYSYSVGDVNDTGKAHFNDSKLVCEKEGTVTIKVIVKCDLDAVVFTKELKKTISIGKMVNSVDFIVSKEQSMLVGNEKTIGKDSILINGQSAVYFSNDAKYEWSSSNANVASVSETGTIKALSAGTAQITLNISYGGSSASSQLTITVSKQSGGSSSGGSGGSRGSGGSGGGYTKSNTASEQIPKQNESGNTGNNNDSDTNKKGFADVPENAWFTEAVVGLANDGIINGKDNNTFAPNDNVTRAEFAKMISLLFKIGDGSDDYAAFNDVDEDAWYAQYVKCVASNGIMQGYEGNFNPENPITREEAATVMFRAAERFGKLSGSGNETKDFVDESEISSWASEAVKRLTEAGIINGNENGSFMPGKNCTRAETAQMLYLLKTK